MISTARRTAAALAAAVIVLAEFGLAVPAQAQGTFGYRKSITVGGGSSAVPAQLPAARLSPNDAETLARV
jgi:hypothetical protein